MRLARNDIVVSVGLLLIVLGLHGPTLGHGFVNWDDDRFITDNPLFAAGGWTYVWAALTRVQFEAYHPLHLLSYLPDRWFWRKSAAGFHGANLAIFGLDVVLLFRLARRHARLGAAAVAVLLFAAHPLCVEPVDWITGRKDILAAAFFLGVLLVEDGRGHDQVHISPVGLSLFAGAILSKTSTLCLPPVLWCWLVWMDQTNPRTAARRVAPYAVVALLPALAVVTIWRQHQMMASRSVSGPVDVLATLATYARRVLLPNDLGAIYSVEVPHPMASATIAFAGAAVLLLSWRKLAAPARFAALAFGASLLPVANVISINYRYSDRYALLALVVLVPPTAAGVDFLFKRSKAARVGTIGALTIATFLLASITVKVSAAWANSRTLWSRATAMHPDAYMARIKYGEALVALHDWSGARDQYQAAVRLLPLNYYGYAGLAYVYARRAEEQGRIPPGSANKWRAQFDQAQVRSGTFDAYISSIPHASCAECLDTLLLLRFRRWPMPDDLLYRAARSALDRASPDVALIVLSNAVDKQSVDWRSLWDEAVRARPKRLPIGPIDPIECAR